MGFFLLRAFSVQVKLVLHAHAVPTPVLSFNRHILLVNSKLKMVFLSLFGRASKKNSLSCQFSYSWAILAGNNRSQSGRISSEIILFSEESPRSFYLVLPPIWQRATLFVFSSQWQNQTQGQHYIPRIFCICYFLISCSDSPKSVKERLWQSPARR